MAQELELLHLFALAPDVSLPALAERCSLRFSGADFYALCADALMRAIREQAEDNDVRKQRAEGLEMWRTLCRAIAIRRRLEKQYGGQP